MPVVSVRLNHEVLFASDLERRVRFSSEILAMEVVACERRVNAECLRLSH